MSKIQIGKKVRLAIDSESIYEIIEINPFKIKGLTIRKFGDGLMIQVSEVEITVID
jgi:cyanate lyase